MEDQKEEIEDQKKEIEVQKKEIEDQKEDIEEKMDDALDSHEFRQEAFNSLDNSCYYISLTKDQRI